MLPVRHQQAISTLHRFLYTWHTCILLLAVTGLLASVITKPWVPEVRTVPVQREMERGRSPLVSIPPLRGGDFQGIRVYRSDDSCPAMHSARGFAPALLNIGSMSPTRLSLSMVASRQSPLPFHPARSL